MPMLDRRFGVVLVGLALLAAVGGCDPNRRADPPVDPKDLDRTRYSQKGGIFGEDGISLFGKKKKAPEAGIGVNGFLWRASLDTISFMPITSADPFGGVIITDWHSPAESPNERFKLNIYILDRALRADGIRVGVFRQVRSGDAWQDAAVSPQAATDIENAILMRARQMRQAVVDQAD